MYVFMYVHIMLRCTLASSVIDLCNYGKHYKWFFPWTKNWSHDDIDAHFSAGAITTKESKIAVIMSKITETSNKFQQMRSHTTYRGENEPAGQRKDVTQRIFWYMDNNRLGFPIIMCAIPRDLEGRETAIRSSLVNTFI